MHSSEASDEFYSAMSTLFHPPSSPLYPSEFCFFYQPPSFSAPMPPYFFPVPQQSMNQQPGAVTHEHLATPAQLKQEEERRTPRSSGPDSPMDANITLWQFLLELLLSGEHQHLIQWTNSEGEFKLLDAEAVARLWGARKNKPHMNYDKLSRALRYYYDKNIIKKVIGQKFVYRFVSFPENSQSDLLAYAVGRVNAVGGLGSMSSFSNLSSAFRAQATTPPSYHASEPTASTSSAASGSSGAPNLSSDASSPGTSADSPASLGSDGRRSTEVPGRTPVISSTSNRKRKTSTPADDDDCDDSLSGSQPASPKRPPSAHRFHRADSTAAGLSAPRSKPKPQPLNLTPAQQLSAMHNLTAPHQPSPLMSHSPLLHNLSQLYAATMASAGLFPPASPLASALSPSHFLPQFSSMAAHSPLTASLKPPVSTYFQFPSQSPLMSPAQAAAALLSPAMTASFFGAALALSSGQSGLHPFAVQHQRMSAFHAAGGIPASPGGGLKTPVPSVKD